MFLAFDKVLTPHRPDLYRDRLKFLSVMSSKFYVVSMRLSTSTFHVPLLVNIVDTPEKYILSFKLAVCATSTRVKLLFEAFGPLVPLSFAITGFTPAAYQRHRL